MPVLVPVEAGDHVIAKHPRNVARCGPPLGCLRSGKPVRNP
ncbi:MAG TPA: hypothetical protein VND19_13030 [Acetobacteraceae bacterium]|nr:hypothetical protein [Acetobacteraceae bacterium]